MSETICIVSIAPWARRSPWWEAARRSSACGVAPASARLLLAFFGAEHADSTAALAPGEAEIIRAWAYGLAHWKDRAESGHFPLRFHAYATTVARPSAQS